METSFLWILVLTISTKSTCHITPNSEPPGVHHRKTGTNDGSNIEYNFVKFLSSLPKGNSDENHQQTEQPNAERIYNISAKCSVQLGYLAFGIDQQSEWALRILDSQFKRRPGFLKGEHNWPGNYEECIAVTGKSTTENKDVFKGQYCTVKASKIRMGVCVPDGCSADDVDEIFSEVLGNSEIGENSTSITSSCQNPHKELTDRAVVAIVILSIIVALIIVGTAVDILVRNLTRSSNPDEEKIFLIRENNNKVEKDKDNIDVPKVEIERNFSVKLLLCFSLYTNGLKLLDIQQKSGTLTTINGIRFLSASWVILCHIYLFIAVDGPFVANRWKMFAWSDGWSYSAIYNGTFSVDSFFAVSGLLVTFLTLKDLKRTKGKMNWLMFYFHRYIRIVVPLAAIMLINICLSEYFYDGPHWPDDGLEDKQCNHIWWRNLFLIQNFFPKPSCVGWSWYLAVDMQLFVISPIFIWLLFARPALGYAVMFILLFVCCLATGVTSKVQHLSSDLFITGHDPQYNAFKNTPWNRMGPYLSGCITGYILHRTNNKFQMKWGSPNLHFFPMKLLPSEYGSFTTVAFRMLVLNIDNRYGLRGLLSMHYTNLICWAVAATVGLATVYGLVNQQRGIDILSEDASAVYHALGRTAWAASLCWLIFACSTKNGGFINTVLSWSPFTVLSRLSFMAYMVHPIILLTYSYSRRELVYLEEYEMIILFLGIECLSYGISVPMYLAFESTVAELEKLLLKREKRN